MKKLLVGLLALALLATPAVAQNAPPTPAPVSVLSGQVTLAVTNTSARVALPSTAVSAVALTVYNKGTVDAYVALGGSSIVATSGGTCAAGISGPSCLVPAGGTITFYSDQTYIAAITASSTTTLVIYQGNGPVQLNGSSGQAVSGTVTSNQGTPNAGGTQGWFVQLLDGLGNAIDDANPMPSRTAATSTSASVTRPANTTTYTANTGWNMATSGSSPGYLTFANFCRANGKSVLLTELKVLDTANSTLKLTGILWLFDIQPTTIINDNATFSVISADASHIKAAIPFSPVTVVNQGSGASGSTWDAETSLGRQITCAAGDTSMYGMVEVTNAYVPVSGEALTFRPSAVGVN